MDRTTQINPNQPDDDYLQEDPITGEWFVFGKNGVAIYAMSKEHALAILQLEWS